MSHPDLSSKHPAAQTNVVIRLVTNVGPQKNKNKKTIEVPHEQKKNLIPQRGMEPLTSDFMIWCFSTNRVM